MKELLETAWKSTRADTPPLEGEELESYLDKLDHQWQIIEHKKLNKVYKFTNFQRALDFVNKVGEWAEEKNHHPDLHLSWGRVGVEIWTHRIGGLAPMDFVWAAHVEKIYQDDYAHLVDND